MILGTTWLFVAGCTTDVIATSVFLYFILVWFEKKVRVRIRKEPISGKPSIGLTGDGLINLTLGENKGAVYLSADNALKLSIGLLKYVNIIGLIGKTRIIDGQHPITKAEYDDALQMIIEQQKKNGVVVPPEVFQEVQIL